MDIQNVQIRTQETVKSKTPGLWKNYKTPDWGCTGYVPFSNE